MSEEKLRRRKFLADILFAGGGLTAAALLAKVSTSDGACPLDPDKGQHLPGQAVVDPKNNHPLPGEAMPVEPTEPIHLDGAAVLPEEPHVKGEMALPTVPKEEPRLAGRTRAPHKPDSDLP